MIATTAARRRLHDAALHVFAEKGSSEVTVSELAEAAGIARGTVYNNIDSLDSFFEDVSRDLALEMRDRMLASFVGVHDPASRLADGLRFFVRRAHDEPGWGRFVARFGAILEPVQQLWAGPAMDDVRAGIRTGRFDLGERDLPGAMALVNGATLTAMWQVLEGHQAWRSIGTSASGLVLRGLGVGAVEARDLAARDLRPLAALDEAHLQVGQGDDVPATAEPGESGDPSGNGHPTPTDATPSAIPPSRRQP